MILTELGQWDSIMSGIGFFDTCGNHWQWPSLTEIMNLKKHNYLLNFLLFVSII